MIELVGSYGLWIALIALFLAMHWFGIRCCGSRHLEHAESSVQARDRKAIAPTKGEAHD